MSLKKNDIFISEIIDITNLGFGVAKHEGAVVFVSGAVTGDVARIRIIKIGASFMVGRVEEFLTKSSHRVENRCHRGQCHSCAYKCLSYEYEKRLKEEAVRQIFKKSGLNDVKIMPLMASPCEKAYRNKAQYPRSRGKDGRYSIDAQLAKSIIV